MARPQMVAQDPHPNPLLSNRPSKLGPLGEGANSSVARACRSVLERVRQMEAVVAAGGGTVAAREQLRGARAVAREMVYGLDNRYAIPTDEQVIERLTELAAGQTHAASTVGQMVSHADADVKRSTRNVQPAWARGEVHDSAVERDRYPQLKQEIREVLERCGPLTFEPLHDELGGFDRCTSTSLQAALAQMVTAGELDKQRPSAMKSAPWWYGLASE